MITSEQHELYLATEEKYNKMRGKERDEYYMAFQNQWIDPNPDSIMGETNYNEFIWWLTDILKQLENGEKMAKQFDKVYFI